jgi:hypothetical protein
MYSIQYYLLVIEERNYLLHGLKSKMRSLSMMDVFGKVYHVELNLKIKLQVHQMER